MLLEPHERQRFLAYCRQQVESCEAIARQMETLPNATHLYAVIKHEKLRALGYGIVANDLESVEDVTVGGG